MEARTAAVHFNLPVFLLGCQYHSSGTAASSAATPLRHREEVAAAVRYQFRGLMQDVQLQAHDGVILRAWYIRPANANGRDVLMLHGITDNRKGSGVCADAASARVPCPVA